MNNEELKIDFKHCHFQDIDTEDSRNSIHLNDRTIDKERNRYPYCIVWTSIPGLSALLPFIGHTGICTKDGVIHDFARPYTILVDNLAFGEPQKFIPLDPDEYSAEIWDQAIQKADNKFRNEMHTLSSNNCHSYCAHVLNLVRYKGKTDWNMLDIWWMSVFKSKFVNRSLSFKVSGLSLLFFVIILVIIFAI